MARRITGTDFLQFPVTQLGFNAASGSPAGITVAVLVKMIADGTGLPFLRTFNAGFTAGWEIGRLSTNRVYWRIWNSTSSPSYSSTSFSLVVADGWCVICVRDPGSTGNAAISKIPVPDGTRVTDALGDVADFDLGATSCDISNTNIDIAAAAVWQGWIDNAPLDLLDHDFYGWTQADSPGGPMMPKAIWRFNQAAITTAVPDYLGGGESESGRSGTSVQTDPAGFAMTFASERRIERPSIYVPLMNRPTSFASVR